jgi:DNA-binding LytR/AlgR family response regulator
MAFKVLLADDDARRLQHVRSVVAHLRPQWQLIDSPPDVAALLTAIQAQQPALCILAATLLQADPTHLPAWPAPGVPVIVLADDALQTHVLPEITLLDDLPAPITDARLAQALLRADLFFEARELASPRVGSPRFVRFFHGKDLMLSPLEDVVYFQAQLKYTRVVTLATDGLLRMGLSAVTRQLAGQRFSRIHRSVLVNLAHVSAARRDEMGRLVVRMAPRDEALVVSRPYEALFRDGFL